MFPDTRFTYALPRAAFWSVGIALAAVVAAGSSVQAHELPQLVVSSDFSSGSGEVESIDQQARVIRVSPSVHSGRGWPCWWYFKITGIEAGETIVIDMGGDKWAQPDRATFSIDQQTWQQTQPGEKRDGRIVYRQEIDATEAWFAWGPPFTHHDAVELVESAAKGSPYAEAWTLCESREGHAVPALRIRQPGTDDSERYGIWIGARQHAWESGSSWVARGLVEWLISDDPRAEALRKRTTICIVPVMDVDNVAIGAGGKNQDPHDHNRDWSDEPRFPAVVAAQREIKRFEETGRFDLYLDLHNPGPQSRESYFYVPPPAMVAGPATANLERFLLAVQAELTGPLPFRGRTVESSRGNDPLWVHKSTVWVVQNTDDHVVGLTLEVPWNTPQSTTDGYRAAGRNVGMALDRYFRQPPEQ